jgi:hypothetical protein
MHVWNIELFFTQEKLVVFIGSACITTVARLLYLLARACIRRPMQAALSNSPACVLGRWRALHVGEATRTPSPSFHAVAPRIRPGRLL